MTTDVRRAAFSTEGGHEGYFLNKRNQKIFTRTWLPASLEKIKALVFLFHGLGEHSGRYNHVAEALNSHNYAVFALDHHGHGKSEGKRMYVERFEDFIEDALLFIDIVSSRNASHLPKFIIGHSMGGAIAVLTAQERPQAWAGVVLSGAAIKKGPDVNSLTVHLAKYLSWAVPNLGVKQIDPNTISTDPEAVKAYENDPLVYHGKVTARMGHELLKAADGIEADCSRVTFPFLACHALDDKLTHPDGSKDLYDKAPSQIKNLILYCGMRHELFNEKDKDSVIDDVIHWMDKRYNELGRSARTAAL